MENAGRQVDGEALADVLKSAGGIGTPATRAAIIERLIQVGYVVRAKKDLVPTQKGEVLVDLVDERLKSPELTAVWEQRWLEIERGARPAGFWTGIVQLTREIIEAVRNQPQWNVPGQARSARPKTRARKARGARRVG
jgi:DNA topoisomerase-3